MKDGQIVLVSGIKEANKKIKMVVALETVSTILIFIEKISSSSCLEGQKFETLMLKPSLILCK